MPTPPISNPDSSAVPVSDDSPFVLGLLLRRAHEKAASAMDEPLAPFGIERRHLVVLMRLISDGALTQKQLVDRTQHDKASMVRIVDDLERLGLASRELVAGDRRLRAVTLTDHGREVFDQAQQAAVPVAVTSVKPLTPDQAEQLKLLLRAYLAG
jgi:DNA-binding MarR family transcriptional regulator